MSVIVDINHETGDLTEYNSTVTDGGDLSAAAAAKLANTSYGLSCVIDDTTGIYGQADFSVPGSGIIRARFYIDPNGLTMGDGDVFYVFRILDGAATSSAQTRLQYTNGVGYQLRVSCIDDGSTEFTLATTTISDAPHYVEVLLQKATGAANNDGVCTWWIDGAQVGTKTDLDSFNRFALIDNIKIGAISGIDAGTSGTLYLDELLVNDDGGRIGAKLENRPGPACYDGPTVY